MTLIIGFGHKCRQGKDTAGAAVVNYYAQQKRVLGKVYGVDNWRNECPVPDVRLYRFAEALYEICAEEYGMKEKNPILLQTVGMEKRAIDENYWVDIVMGRISLEKPDIAVITDMRFINEAGAIKEKNGVTVCVSRLNTDGSQYISDDRPDTHASEIALDGYNFDHRIVVKEGHAALTEQLAITIVEYERALRQ